jgi:ankyrin repeat protein
MQKHSRISSILIVLLGILAGTQAHAQKDGLLDATNYEDVARVKALIAAKADVNARYINGTTVLALASLRGQMEIVHALIDAGADVNATRSDGSTALMAAVQFNRLEAIRALLAAGADVNAKTQDGVTALMLASMAGFPEVMKGGWPRCRGTVRTTTEDGCPRCLAVGHLG